MKNEMVTTVEQSRKLLEVGVDPNTADMWRVDCDDANYFITNEKYIDLINGCEVVPAWSLSALMNIMPKGFVLVKDSVVEKYHLFSKGCMGKSTSAENPIDTVFSMIVYLKENKLL